MSNGDGAKCENVQTVQNVRLSYSIYMGVMWVGGEQDTSGLPRAWSRHAGRVRSGYTGDIYTDIHTTGDIYTAPNR